MEKNARPPLIVIGGPTATGKSRLAAELGRRIGGEVVSADAMQVYRYMDIGSAKVTREEMLGVPHHMIDVTDPTEPMDAARYESMAKKCIDGILERGRIPILCGGTGFYIQAVTRGIDFGGREKRDNTAIPAAGTDPHGQGKNGAEIPGKSAGGTDAREQDPDDVSGKGRTAGSAYREQLRDIAETRGNAYLHSMLAVCDPEAARAIHPNNVKRTIRALEYFRDTGEKISDHNREEAARVSPYDLHFFVLTDEREKLYERIDRRVDFMFSAGLVDEVQYLRAMGLGASDVSMQGIGYRQVLAYLDGKMEYDETVRVVKRDSRHYAKRQVTWFKREKDAVWISRSDFDGDDFRILGEVLRQLAVSGLIGENIPSGPLPMFL